MDCFDLRLWPGFNGDPHSPAHIDQITLDSRRIDSPNALFVALPGALEDGHHFVSHAAHAGAKYAIVKNDWQSPAALPPHITLLRVKDPLKAFQQIAKTYRKQKKALVIGITGSYGKTMVKDMLHALLNTTKCTVASPESFNSQIGVALSLLTITDRHEIAIIEAGISQKNEMDILADMIAPDYCIVTPIGKKHVATLGDLHTIISEKLKLAIHPSAKEWVMIPRNALLQPYLKQLSQPCVFWNEKNDHLPHASGVMADHSCIMPYTVDFPNGSSYEGRATSGFYYCLDLLNITIKAAWMLGVSSDAMIRVLKEYASEPMRTEIWKSSTGSTFINDTYCSDPQSVDQALKYLQHSISGARNVLIFGGIRSNNQHVKNDYKRIGQAIARSQIRLLILTGKHAFSSLINEVRTHSSHTEIVHCEDYRKALHYLQGCIKPDDTVLIKGDSKQPLDSLIEIFNDSICSNHCFINLAAIQSNIGTLKSKLAKDCRIMVMVKALAYGTDDVRMAKFLKTYGIDLLGVSYVDEGVALRRAGVGFGQEIFVINAALYEVVKIVKWDLAVGVSDKEFIRKLNGEALKQNKKVKVHLHVDTGMSRFGCRSEQALELGRIIKESSHLEFDGVMTHFACADNPQEDEFTMNQVRCFDAVIEKLEAEGIAVQWKHACNSSAVARFDFSQYNMVRVGLAIYGLYPSEAVRESMDLRLALSLTSRIVGINVCKAGETISYGRSYKVIREEQKIAVLPIGYFDGLHRNYSDKGYVIIRGQKAPMVGKICMDFMMVDITDIPNAAIGDAVLIFGEDEYGNYLSPEDLATSGDSIVYELITCLGPRIQRIFIHEEAHHLR